MPGRANLMYRADDGTLPSSVIPLYVVTDGDKVKPLDIVAWPEGETVNDGEIRTCLLQKSRSCHPKTTLLKIAKSWNLKWPNFLEFATYTNREVSGVFPKDSDWHNELFVSPQTSRKLKMLLEIY